MEKYDFAGWATKSNTKCSDGRTIMKDAFRDNDGQIVPLVWSHQHNDPNYVLGHALLKNRDEGVYAYCTFNDSENGKMGKLLVQHGDVKALSIYANQLKQNMANVVHGNIREVSLVLAGANPGAFIESVIAHGEESDEEAIIYSGEDISLYHSADGKGEKQLNNDDKKTDEKSEGKTVKEILDTFTPEQRLVVEALVGQALSEGLDEEEIEEGKTEGGKEEMKHNIFENDDKQNDEVLSHDDMKAIIDDAKRYGSLKDSFLAHADGDATLTYGIKEIDTLFPDMKNLNVPPDFIKRDTTWVQKVMSGVHRTPFSRIKSMFADIREDEARARGYIKGKLKKEEVFSLLKRTTTPTTIYKKQKLDRDDIIDITDFDVVAWIKGEMRIMLDEEIARAVLVGDGRLASSDDKINESCIRPIWKDEDLYCVKNIVKTEAAATGADKAKAFIDTVIRSRKNYKGSGTPTLYTTEDWVTECLLLEDGIGHKLYKSINELATTLRVKDIVTVEVMEGLTRETTVEGAAHTNSLIGIIVNLADYNVGADKGGAINMFDDFDIDYNQQKYLMETRCSGALIKPFSAMVYETSVANG